MRKAVCGFAVPAVCAALPIRALLAAEPSTKEAGAVIADETLSVSGQIISFLGSFPAWSWPVEVLLLIAIILVWTTRGDRQRKDRPDTDAGRASLNGSNGSINAALTSAGLADNGRLAGKYELIRMIGRGGMGCIFEAVDHSLGRSVAIKQMSDGLTKLGPRAREMIVREAKTVAAVHHPGIVDIYEILEYGACLYLVFELLRGKTVQQLLAEQRRLAPGKALEILRPVCQALDYAHSRNLVHRDLKPANIMVTEQGHVKLMDFGIARSLTEGRVTPAAVRVNGNGTRSSSPSGQFAHTTTLVGTPQYMAPETEQGIVCKQADVYSLGACLYEMLTGQPPFELPAALEQKLEMDFIRPTLRVAELTPRIDELIVRALQPHPALRIQTPGEFLSMLDAAVKDNACGDGGWGDGVKS